MRSKCIIWWRSFHRNGYGRATDPMMNRQILAHRLAWQECFGEIPTGMFVLHKCDNPKCVNPEHLKLGTHQDNMRDMELKGRSNSPQGEDKWCAKLTEEDVMEMRRLRTTGFTFQQIADKFSCTRSYACRVINGHYWRHV
jgi:hypothetical protein